MQAYSNPKRESDPYSLPDLEVWPAEVYRYDCRHCGEYEIDEDSATADLDGAVCPSCERSGPGEGTLVRIGRRAWWWRSCFPGCMPDSGGTFGPFDSKAEALADARDGMDDDDDDDDETV